MIGVLLGQSRLQSKVFLKCIIQPHPSGRAAKQIVVLRKQAPHASRIHGWPVSYPKVFQSKTLAVKHSIDVVIRRDEKSRRIRKGLVLRKPLGICMAVRTENGKRTNFGVQA